MDNFDEYLEELRKIHNKGPVEEQIKFQENMAKRIARHIKINRLNNRLRKFFGDLNFSKVKLKSQL
jgi:predicted ATP-dependent Lon-type protease